MQLKLSAQAPHTQVYVRECVCECVCVGVSGNAICARFKTRARFWINLYANILAKANPF